jgi:hypothetical protein
MSNPHRIGGDTPQKKERLKTKREKKSKRLRKKLARKREKARKKLIESDPEINYLVVNCQTKRGFATKLEALKYKPSDLHVYECEVCMGWHFTSRPRKTA